MIRSRLFAAVLFLAAGIVPPVVLGPTGPDPLQWGGGKGATGATGPQGPPGATGPQGPPGTNGAPGAPGANGTNGAAGPAGVAGATGATGVAGPTGAMGANGATGATGPAGDVGAPGAPGPAGATGPAGLGASYNPVAALAAIAPDIYTGGGQTFGWGFISPVATTCSGGRFRWDRGGDTILAKLWTHAGVVVTSGTVTSAAGTNVVSWSPAAIAAGLEYFFSLKATNTARTISYDPLNGYFMPGFHTASTKSVAFNGNFLVTTPSAYGNGDAVPSSVGSVEYAVFPTIP